MTIGITNTLAQLECFRSIHQAEEIHLVDIQSQIREIDPDLLGEERAVQHSCLKIIYAIFYFLKNIYYHSTICNLQGRLTNCIEDIRIVKEKINTVFLRLGLEKRALLGELETVKRQIRELNPAALGEPRFDETTHWWITNKVLHSYFAAMDRWRAPQLNPLIEKKNAYEAQLASLPELPAPIDPFEELQISEEEKRQIRVLIPSVANDSTLELIFKLREIFQAKAKLETLHPLKSLEQILKDPGLKENLLTIKKDPEKWLGRHVILWGFIKGFLPQTAEKLQKYHNQTSLIPCLPGFAKSLALSREKEEQITHLAQNQQWERFVEALLEQPPSSQR